MHITRISLSNIEPFKVPIIINLSPGGATTPSGTSVDLITGENGTGKSRILACIAYLAGAIGAMKSRGMIEPTSSSGGIVVQPNDVEKDEPVCLLGVSFRKDSSPFPGFIGLRSNTKQNCLSYADVFSYSGRAYLEDADASKLRSARQGAEDDGQESFVKSADYNRGLVRRLISIQSAAAQEYRTRMNATPPVSNQGFSELTMTKLEKVLTTRFGNGHQVVFKSQFDPPSLWVRWNGSYLDFSMLPDGLKVILGWLVDLVLRLHERSEDSQDPFERPFIVLMDEPECHLHPAWQRQIIPMAQELFPCAQFIVATHSPFVVMSLNAGKIHKLKNSPDGVICESRLASPGDSYVTAIREIFDVQEMYDPETESLFAEFRKARDTARGGDEAAKVSAGEILDKIAGRSEELALVARAEAVQLSRLLGKK